MFLLLYKNILFAMQQPRVRTEFVSKTLHANVPIRTKAKSGAVSGDLSRGTLFLAFFRKKNYLFFFLMYLLLKKLFGI